MNLTCKIYKSRQLDV